MRARVTGVAVLLVAVGALAGCSDPKPVSQARLAKVIATQMAQDLGELPHVRCDGDLEPTKGQSQRCTLTDRGASYRVHVTVTDTQGNLKADLDKPLPAFPPARLEASVARDYQGSHGTAPSAVRCASGLSQTPGDHTTCDLAVGDQHATATVTTGELDKATGITDFTTTYAP